MQKISNLKKSFADGPMVDCVFLIISLVFKFSIVRCYYYYNEGEKSNSCFFKKSCKNINWPMGPWKLSKKV